MSASDFFDGARLILTQPGVQAIVSREHSESIEEVVARLLASRDSALTRAIPETEGDTSPDPKPETPEGK